MWELDYKESWALKNWCFWTVVLEKTLESSIDCKENKQVNSKGDQPWIFIGRTDAEAPILWPPDVKSQHTGKDRDAGKDWGQEENGAIEEEMVGWHHWLNGYEFEQTLGDSEGQGSMSCGSPWSCKELVSTEQLSNKNNPYSYIHSDFLSLLVCPHPRTGVKPCSFLFLFKIFPWCPKFSLASSRRILSSFIWKKVKVLVTQLCPTLCEPSGL